MQEVKRNIEGDYELYEKILKYGTLISAIFLLGSFIPYLINMPMLFNPQDVTSLWHLPAKEFRQSFISQEIVSIESFFIGDILAYCGLIAISTLSLIAMSIVGSFYLKNNMRTIMLFAFGNVLIMLFALSGIANNIF